MSCIQRLIRHDLKFRIQNLSSRFVAPSTKRQVRFASTTLRYDTYIDLNKILPPFLRYSPVTHNQIHRGIYIRQHRSTHAAANTKLENFLLPDIGEGISEVVIRSWQVKVGDVVQEFDPICEVESDKATATISSRYAGTIRSVYYEVGAMAKVGKPLVDIEVTGSSQVKQVSKNEPQQDNLSQDTKSGRVETIKSKASISALPSVRRFAQEMGVDLALVEATGSRGQILREDVLSYLNTKSQHHQKSPSTPSPTPKPSPTSSRVQASTVIPLGGIQRAMFRTMTESLKIPHFNYADEIDLTQLMEQLRPRDNSSKTKKIANFAFIIKMLSLALKEYPQLNASIDETGENLIHKHYHNIGIAIDTKAGLIVPNIKNVQDLSVEQVNSELIRLRELGYASKLGPTDLSGATITLSNIGAIGGTFGVPVIVSPEIVIGALGRIRKLPRFNSQGQVEARHVMQLVWSADHRVVDGATLSRFSNLLKEYLEAPHSALLKLT